MSCCPRPPSPVARKRSIFCALLALLIMLLAALAGRGAAPWIKVDPQEIERLVRDLADDNYDTRQAASKVLRNIGEPALPALRKAARSTDPDVCLRAFVLIRAIDRSLLPEVTVLTGHTNAVVCVDISRDGKYLVSGGNDATARVWDLTTGQQLRQMAPEVGNVWGVALTADARQVLVGRAKGTLTVHDVGTGRAVRSFTKQIKAVRCVVLLPDGKRVMTANFDPIVRQIEIETGKELKRYTGHTGGQLSLACSRDGRFALTGGGQREKIGRLWDVESGKQLHALTGHEERILGAAFSPDSRFAATASWDNTVRLWDVATGKLVRTFSGSQKFSGLAFSPDGKLLAAGDLSGVITFWNPTTGKMLRRLEEHTAGVNVLRFSADGRILVSAGKDKTIRVWKMRK